MKKLALAALVALLVTAGASATNGTFAVNKVSETATTITLGWAAQAGADGYRFYADGAAVSRTFDPARTSVRFAKGASSYKVEVLHVSAGDSGVYPPPVAPPPAEGFPDATNTGVPAGTTLTPYTGPDNITTPNTVIDGKTIGCIEVSAPGVVIKNSKITCNGFYAVFVADTGTPMSTPLLVEDSDVSCNGEGTAIGEADITVLRTNIHDCENGFDANRDITVRDSFIHALYQSATAHPDGFQSSGHYEGSTVYPWAKNLTIVHNTIYGSNEVTGEIGNAAMIFGRGGDTNILIDNNLFAGGGYTIYCEQNSTGNNFRITNNHFSTRFGPKVGYYGPSTDCSDEIQSGNVIDETGQPLTLG